MKFFILVLLMFLCIELDAQILTPVRWSNASKIINSTSAIVYFKADIDPGWHIYSVNQDRKGPVKTSITYKKSSDYNAVGLLKEPAPKTRFEPVFGVNVSYFEKTVIFSQKIKISSGSKIIKGHLTYMACNDHQCLPPEEIDFNIKLR
jgi:DsbC/DsbD-like thiol-disulfide interchange protein